MFALNNLNISIIIIQSIRIVNKFVIKEKLKVNKHNIKLQTDYTQKITRITANLA